MTEKFDAFQKLNLRISLKNKILQKSQNFAIFADKISDERK